MYEVELRRQVKPGKPDWDGVGVLWSMSTADATRFHSWVLSSESPLRVATYYDAELDGPATNGELKRTLGA